MSDTGVLIVTYNSRADIPVLLDDIDKLAPPGGLPVTVIDNASQDGTAGIIKEQFPRVNLVANPENSGFIRAVNQGIELCGSDFVYLINPDIQLHDPHFFPAMLAGIQASPRIAAVGPLQFKRAGGDLRLNFTWSYSSPRALWLHMVYALSGKTAFQSPLRTPFLNAGCLLLRRSAFVQVGKLNEKYFMYGEEPDLFLKFKRHGYECRLLPGVRVIHARERSVETLSESARLKLRQRALMNIIDALATGYYQILVNELRRRLADLAP